MITLQETIRPSADLRNHYNEISRQCREEKEVVIITVNGRGDAAIIMHNYAETIEVMADHMVQ